MCQEKTQLKWHLTALGSQAESLCATVLAVWLLRLLMPSSPALRASNPLNMPVTPCPRAFAPADFPLTCSLSLPPPGQLLCGVSLRGASGHRSGSGLLLSGGLSFTAHYRHCPSVTGQLLLVQLILRCGLLSPNAVSSLLAGREAVLLSCLQCQAWCLVDAGETHGHLVNHLRNCSADSELLKDAQSQKKTPQRDHCRQLRLLPQRYLRCIIWPLFVSPRTLPTKDSTPP